MGENIESTNRGGNMSVISKMEKKFGKYAIKNLTLYIIIGYAVGYLLLMFMPKVLFYIVLNPALVMKGQVWRLVTWVITPPSGFSVFTIIMLLFYYSMGTRLERTVGTFLYNVYMLGGMLITMVGTMLTYIFCEYVLHYHIETMSMGSGFFYVSTYYICLSIFLAVAVCYPDMTVLYAMIIPVKMKWLSVLYLILAAYYFRWESLLGRVNIVLSLVSFIIFYLSTKNLRRFTPKEMKRRRTYTKQVRMNRAENVTHKCEICGITDKDDPNMQFRYCSKCKGNKEYCQKHLYTHTHV